MTDYQPDLFYYSPVSMGIGNPIECVASYKDFLYLGTKKGSVYIYKLEIDNIGDNTLYHVPSFFQITPDKTGGNFAFSSKIFATKNIGKKSISQLTTVPELDILFGIVDNQLSCFTLPTCQFISTIPNEVNLFTYLLLSENDSEFKSNNVNLLLCICNKKKLSFFFWSKEEQKFLDASLSSLSSINSWSGDLFANDNPKSISFLSSTSLLIFLKNSVIKYDKIKKEWTTYQDNLPINNDSIAVSAPFFNQKISTDICEGFVKVSTKPMNSMQSFFLQNVSSGVIDKSINCLSHPVLFTSSTTNSTDQMIFLIDENDRVASLDCAFNNIQSVIYFPPFLLVGCENYLEVYSKNDLKNCLQRIPLRRVKFLTHNSGIVYAITGAGGGHPDNEGKNKNEIWFILGPKHKEFSSILANNKNFDLSILLCEIFHQSGQSPENSTKITTFNCLDLLSRGEYTKAFNILYQIGIDPKQILSLFPMSSVFDEFEGLKSYLIDSDEEEKYLVGFSDSGYLIKWRNHLNLASIETNKTEFSCYSMEDWKMNSNKIDDYQELIDTNLIKYYLKTNRNIIGSLLRVGCKCNLAETEKALIDSNQFDDLMRLYKSFGCHEKALELLDFALKTDSIDVVNEYKQAKKIESLDLPESGDSRKILDYFIGLNNSHWNLLEKYGNWLMENRSNEWMEILLNWERRLYENVEKNSNEELRTSLNYRFKVLKYLNVHKPSIVIPLLEMFLFTNFDKPEESYILNEDDSDELREKYPEKMDFFPAQGEYQSLWVLPTMRSTYLRRSIPETDSLPTLFHNPKLSTYDESELHTKYVEALASEINRLKPEEQKLALRVKEEISTDGAIARLRHRLLDFSINDKAKYDASFLLSKIPADSLFEERAALLFRNKRYDQVLVIWLYVLNDWKSVLRICDKVYTYMKATLNDTPMDKSENQSHQQQDHLDNIYHILIDICLRNPNMNNFYFLDHDENLAWQPKINCVLELLKLHGDRICPEFVVENLPDDLSFHEVHQFLQASIIRRESELSRLVILSASVKRELYESRIDRDRTMNQAFHLSENLKCAQCWKPIGASAFVRYFTSGDIIHYGCCKEINEGQSR